MDETFNDEQKKKGISKGVIAFIVAILVIGGSVAAYFMLNISEKDKYFLSEKKSFEFMTDKFEERYQPELDWYEKSEENPTETKFTLSGEYNDPAGSELGMGPEQFINNSTIDITTATDMKEQKVSTKLSADIGGIKIDDIDFYLTSKEITLGLPFINELVQVKDDDLGKLLHEVDPLTFEKDGKIDLGTLFNGSNGTLSDEDIEYLKKEYLDMIYNELPDEAFDSSDDKIKVNDESMKTEKITMHLTEKQLKEIITKVLDKMENDKRLKDLIKEQIELQPQFGLISMDDEIDEFMSDFESRIADSKDAVKDFQIPDGLTSVIWIKDDLIVQRDFNIEMGPSEDELVAFTIKGTQLLENDNQFFNYDLGFSDDYEDGTMNISGDLSWKDGKAKDSINLTAADTALSYESTETLKDDKRDFERVFSFEDPSGAGGSLIWDGNASYDKDQMKSEHNFSIEVPEVGQDMFALHIAVDGKTIKEVEMPDDGNVKDLGSMSADEIMQYFNEEVAPSFQQWMMKMIGAGGLGF